MGQRIAKDKGYMKRVLEIRPAEGGEDSKLLAMDLMAAYIRMFERLS